MRKELLYSAIGALYVTAQIITAVRVEAFPFLPSPYNLVPGGVIAYLSIFVVASIMNEREGKREGLRIIFAGLFANFLFLFNVYIEGAIPEVRGVFPEYSSQTYQWLLGMEMRIILGSIIAFVVAMHVNNTLYYRWKWNIWGKYSIIMIVAMSIDTSLFHTVAYLGIFSFDQLVGSIFSVTALKILLTIVSIPFFAFGLKGYAWLDLAEERLVARVGA